MCIGAGDHYYGAAGHAWATKWRHTSKLTQANGWQACPLASHSPAREPALKHATEAGPVGRVHCGCKDAEAGRAAKPTTGQAATTACSMRGMCVLAVSDAPEPRCTALHSTHLATHCPQRLARAPPQRPWRLEGRWLRCTKGARDWQRGTGGGPCILTTALVLLTRGCEAVVLSCHDAARTMHQRVKQPCRNEVQKSGKCYEMDA